MCLFGLNAEEQTKLIPFKIDIPKPLFDYASYITSINGRSLIRGVLDFLNEYEGSYLAIAASLILLFIRKSKNLNTLSLSNNNLGFFGGKEIAKALFENESNLVNLNLSNVSP